jgi:hypothetical protein
MMRCAVHNLGARTNHFSTIDTVHLFKTEEVLGLFEYAQ